MNATPTDPIVDPDLRGSALRLLALPFRPPTEEVFDAFRSGEYLEALGDHAGRIPHLAAALEEGAEGLEAARLRLAESSLTDFEVAFAGTFVAGFTEPPCPPYEGEVRKKDSRVQLMLEVAEFYRHFGLQVSQEEGKREPPDHLRAELEFLRFLCFKEAQARREATPELLQGYVLAQRDFLARHLAVWARPFADAVRASGKHAWFGATADVLARFLAGELALVDGYLARFPPPARKANGVPAEA